jgi:hypothetical protein
MAIAESTLAFFLIADRCLLCDQVILSFRPPSLPDQWAILYPCTGQDKRVPGFYRAYSSHRSSVRYRRHLAARWAIEYSLQLMQGTAGDVRRSYAAVFAEEASSSGMAAAARAMGGLHGAHAEAEHLQQSSKAASSAADMVHLHEQPLPITNALKSGHASRTHRCMLCCEPRSQEEDSMKAHASAGQAGQAAHPAPAAPPAAAAQPHAAGKPSTTGASPSRGGDALQQAIAATPRCHLQPHAFFVSWQGVVTLAHRCCARRHLSGQGLHLLKAGTCFPRTDPC